MVGAMSCCQVITQGEMREWVHVLAGGGVDETIVGLLLETELLVHCVDHALHCHQLTHADADRGPIILIVDRYQNTAAALPFAPLLLGLTLNNFDLVVLQLLDLILNQLNLGVEPIEQALLRVSVHDVTVRIWPSKVRSCERRPRYGRSISFVNTNGLSSSRMRNMSELDKARARRPGESDAVLIEALAADLGTELELEPAVDVDLLASAQGIGRVEVVDIPWSGCLLTDGTGMRIQVRQTDPRPRRRFTTCHEVAHTLLPGFTTTNQYRCTPGDGVAVESTDRNIETLADIAASELLLPRRHAQADLVDAPFGWYTVEEVASVYDASLDATARRLIALSRDPVMLINLKVGTSRSNPTPTLRVSNCAQSGTWPFIPTNKSVPAGHAIHDAYIGEAVDMEADLGVLLRSGSLPVRLSARLYPYYDNKGSSVMRVLALATPVTGPARSRHV